MGKIDEVLISVIIPAYNCQDWIDFSIESVLTQSHSNLELIVVNDGSTDNTYKKLLEYEKNSKVQVFTIKNSGPAIARNFGVSKAKGDLIAFLDADDLWSTEKLKKQLNYLEQNKSKIVLTNIKLINSNGETIGYQKKFIPNSKKAQVINLFEGKLTQNTPTILMKKSVFFEVGGFNTKLLHREDHYLLMKVAHLYGIDLLEEFLVERRVWENSMSSDYKNINISAESVVKHFYNTRFQFIEESIKEFEFLKPLLKKNKSYYNYHLSHTLLKLGYKNEARNYLKKALINNFTLKYSIKLLMLYFPDSLISNYYKKS